MTAAQEDYLEAIYELERSDRVARVKDIARRLGVSTPSVSGALKGLKRKKLVRHETYGHVTLTPRGLETAEGVLRRHELLVRFLETILQLPRKQAEQEACEMEHAVSAETLKRLAVLIEFVENCPRGGRQWLARLTGRWDDFHCERNCKECIAEIEIPVELPVEEELADDGRPTLANQAPGWSGTVTRIGGRGAIRRRLMEMGVTSGSAVEVERVAPLGDPLEVKIRGYHLSLRKEEAAKVHVESK